METELKDSYLGSTQIRIRTSHLNVENFKIGSRSTQLDIEGEQESRVNVENFEVYDPLIAYNEQKPVELKTRTIELSSSLPENAALPSGSTVVQTAILRVKRSVFFTPSEYRLQFNINYSFQPKVKQEPRNRELMENSDSDEVMLFANTIPFHITIRQSVHYMILGSATGGLIGSIARLLQISSVESWKDFIANQLTLTNFLVQLLQVAVPMALST